VGHSHIEPSHGKWTVPEGEQGRSRQEPDLVAIEMRWRTFLLRVSAQLRSQINVRAPAYNSVSSSRRTPSGRARKLLCGHTSLRAEDLVAAVCKTALRTRVGVNRLPPR
jgi:hypothetical protein